MKNKDKYLTRSAHFQEEDIEKLTSICAKTGHTTSAMIRGLLRYGLKQAAKSDKELSKIIKGITNGQG